MYAQGGGGPCTDQAVSHKKTSVQPDCYWMKNPNTFHVQQGYYGGEECILNVMCTASVNKVFSPFNLKGPHSPMRSLFLDTWEVQVT